MGMFLLSDAKFYSERLCNLYPSENNLHILAKCYYQENKKKQTYLLLQGTASLANRYLFAACCLDQGKLEEAERALLLSEKGHLGKITHENVSSIPGGVAGVVLLGKIARKSHRRDASIEYFKLAIEVSRFNDHWIVSQLSFILAPCCNRRSIHFYGVL